MRYSTGKSIYSRSSAYEGVKDEYMRAFLLSNELSRLEHEKKLAAIKISTLEKKIDDVRNEIQAINTSISGTNVFVEREAELPNPKKRHVTLEY